MKKSALLHISQLFISIFLLTACSKGSDSTNTSSRQAPLRVGIAPYQEMALLVNEKDLGLEKKYGTKLEFLTMPWEDLLPAVGSAGQTIDVGFASLPDYLAKTENLNKQGDDPILFLYPAWNFHGGGLISFNPSMPQLTPTTVKDKETVKKFFTYKLGVQTNSCFHMLIWLLAHHVGIKFSDVKPIDTTLNEGFLAALNGGLDATGAGLPQTTEAIKRHGRVVLAMDTLDLTDVGGFICKESVYKARKHDIESLIKIWFDCTNYVLNDLDHHSQAAIAYLRLNASTKYTLNEFKNALSHEYIPTSIAEAEKNIVHGKGKYSISRLTDLCNRYLLDIGAIKSAQPVPKLIDLSNQ